MDGTDGRVAAARQRRERSRRSILEAARTLFARDGYGPTSIEAVAALAGVGPATVYNCFGTKGALAASLLQADAKALVAAARSDLAAGPAAVAALRRQWGRIRRMSENHRPLVAIFLSALQETGLSDQPPAPEHDPRRLVPIPASLAEIVGYGQKRGEFRTDLDPLLVATAMANVQITGFINRRSAAEQDQFLELFLGGLKAAGGENNS